MIITCPSCSARYPVDAASFAPSGRKVRCAKCGHTWHQAPPADLPRAGGEDEDDDVGYAEPAAEAAVEAPEPKPEFTPPQKPLFKSEPAETADDKIATATTAEESAPPVEIGGMQAGTGGKLRSYLNDVASMRRGRVLGAIGWTLLVIFVAGTIYGAVQFRKEIASFWPSAAKLYEAAGAPINLLGLEFRNISYERQSENGLPVLAIKGTVVNVSDEVKTLPRLRVGLRDAKQRELYHWTFAPPEKELKPKQSTSFTTRLSSPPVDARDLEVRFVLAGEDAEPQGDATGTTAPEPAH
ncbi:MAG: zinc-ribbon domain-containing protein [Parvibaculum sp.]|uniref:DUF3426 domain-containing protein n=1 Tax=Parvibaculum sp. TaxID=2024848 RepID=UPI0025D6D114|nr:DUF3426 domain-containing protein [Parvibaculum sp.]MCE9648565.1 zinc-ribbon domain-containing protein [Parvibaculum sp.]